ncbi:transposase [Pseudarthrobacter sp. TAF60_1]|uniref:transposase n=1 Tax=Pseudarthrobacter sp. TAF60_1 TaxID=3233071 RepID=UPI003F969F58
MIFNLPDYPVTSTGLVPDGARHITAETTFPPGCPSCGVISSRAKEGRCQRLRDIPVAGRVQLRWDKRRWFCDEYLCERKSFCEATPQVPRRARSTRDLRETVLDAVITSGRAVSETAMAFGISWWLVQQVIGDAAPRLPDVDLLVPRMLGLDEHRYRSVRFFQHPGTKAWTRYEPWMTTHVDLDTGQVLGIVDERDHKGVGDWLFARPLDRRLGVQVVAIDPSAAFRKALRMWLPRTAVSVDLFHMTMLAKDMLTSADDPTGSLQAAWQVKEQLRTLLNASSLEAAAAAKSALADLVERAAVPEKQAIPERVPLVGRDRSPHRHRRQPEK